MLCEQNQVRGKDGGGELPYGPVEAFSTSILRNGQTFLLAELHKALQGIVNRLVSGINNLPVEFYKYLWAVMDVLDVLQDSVNVSQLYW